MYQYFQFDRDAIAKTADNIAAMLAETNPDENPGAFAAKVIAGRLRQSPGDYLQFGPYWWSVKHALRGEGHNFGDIDVASLRSAYGAGLTPHQTMVAGEQFRDYYREQLMGGTSTFALGGDDETDAGVYALFDMDMEILRHDGRRGGIRSLAEIEGSVALELPVPTFDQVHIDFEEGGELWSAVIDGVLVGDGADPAKLVAELQSTGQIGRAIDAGKGLRNGSPDVDGSYAVSSDPERREVRIERRSRDER